MMADDLTGLTTLLAVVDKRSFTAAAAALRVTPSAVSQAVRAVEARVGVRLLQRTTRSVGLTEAGARFVAQLRPALDQVGAAFASVGELRDRPAGLLKLSVSHVAYAEVIEPVLARFLAGYPDISIEIVVDDGLTNIVAQGIDAGIRLGETVDREMVAVAISGHLRSAVVGAPAYFAARGKPKHPRDLHAHDCINVRQVTRGGIYRWEFAEAGKEFEIAVDGRITANDAGVVVRAACDGLGLAYVIESSVRDELSDQRLVRVLEPYCPSFPGYYLYYSSRAHLAPKLRVLVDFLRRGATRKRRPGETPAR
ncbi:MAG TPA: LysR family transcriptional regulator [Kofleriaceae bacterium]|jgi:DNA-binding transcriptional LysR family regulator|nr:LysR family transcriptional regulator [Kofleriaceae bacterium]